MAYELIDHTADIGIRINESTITDLFETTAYAMFEQITDTSRLNGTHTKNIRVKGIDRPDLLINWLRELLWCWTIDNCLVREIAINSINMHSHRGLWEREEFRITNKEFRTAEV